MAPTITVAMPVRNESNRYLREVLQSAATWADRIVVLDDCSEDDSAIIARDCGADVYHTPAPMFHNEWRLRSLLWAYATASPTDWVFALDADELLQDGWADEARFHLNYPEGAWVAFRFFDLWDSRETYRDDHLWDAHRRYSARMVRLTPGMAYQWRQTPQHCGSLPVNACYGLGNFGHRAYSGILHLGWMTTEDRARKVARYAALNPGGIHGCGPALASVSDPTPHLSRLEGVKTCPAS